MNFQQLFQRAAIGLTFAAAVSILFSIAVCHTLMALALAAVLLSGERLRFPPVLLPLGIFLLATVISTALSTNPSAGRPQIRKFFVFLILLLVSTALRDSRWARRLLIGWVAIAALSAALGLFQFLEKHQQAAAAGKPFYEFYIGERITGFMSHWMTFGGHMMLTFLLLAAFILFCPSVWRRLVVWLACGVLIAAAIALGYTRSIWLATAAGGLYLLWNWRRWVILLLPVPIALAVGLGPSSIRERVVSAVRPHGELDSNQHRVVSWRTGWRMIQAHPWFGLGPEHVKLEFEQYVPADVPRPLPEGWYGHLHNIYLHYAAERGVPALLALMWLLGKILYDFLNAVQRAPAEDRYFLHGAVAAVIAVLVAGLFELNLGDTEVLTLFLAIVAAGYVVIAGSGTLPGARRGAVET